MVFRATFIIIKQLVRETYHLINKTLKNSSTTAVLFLYSYSLLMQYLIVNLWKHNHTAIGNESCLKYLEPYKIENQSLINQIFIV